MNNIKQALESAIEFIEGTASFIPVDYDHIGIDAVKQCKAALAELENCEPVAWISDDENFIEFRRDSLLELSYKENEIFPLYTSPPQQQWVGLSEDEIVKIYGHITLVDWTKVEAIEAKLKQLNMKG